MRELNDIHMCMLVMARPLLRFGDSGAGFGTDRRHGIIGAVKLTLISIATPVMNRQQHFEPPESSS